MGINLGFWLILNPIKFYWKKKKIVSFLFVLFYLPSFLIAFFADSNFREYMKKGFSDCYDDFITSLKVFVLILIPLLLVGAIIEGFLISILM